MIAADEKKSHLDFDEEPDEATEEDLLAMVRRTSLNWDDGQHCSDYTVRAMERCIQFGVTNAINCKIPAVANLRLQHLEKNPLVPSVALMRTLDEEIKAQKSKVMKLHTNSI